MSEEIVWECSGTLADYSVREVGRAILNELDMLRNRIAELEAAQRWIPVSERLPEEGEQVWATDGCHIWVPEFYQKWGGECLSFGAIDDLVTHWLPCSWLPELPEVTE